MLLDYQNQIASAQLISVTTATYSEDKIPLGAIQQIAAGEPIGVFVNVTANSTSDTTLTVEVIAADDASATNAVVLGRNVFSTNGATSTAPVQGFVGASAPHTRKDYLYARFTIAGTTPQITLDAYVHPQSGIQTSGID